jgi:hypothetical protein
MSTIWFDHVDPVEYVDYYYIVDMYKKAYEKIVYPMLGEDHWIKINYDKLKPPVYRIPPGRPRKLRTRRA